MNRVDKTIYATNTAATAKNISVLIVAGEGVSDDGGRI